MSITQVTIPMSSRRDAPNAGLQPAPELTIVIPTFTERDNVMPMIERLRQVLTGQDWEAIFVDDNSPDGTAALVRSIGEVDRRIRCIRRIGRRGLAGACIEGMLASQAQYVAVLDSDLQHDETLLIAMLEHLRRGDTDLVVATRYRDGGDALGLVGTRLHASRWSNVLARRLLGVGLSDPMSGFFMIRRTIFEEFAPKLSSQGFKILLDIVSSAHGHLNIVELPYAFRNRMNGESKLDTKVALDFAALLVSKLTHDVISLRFFLFCLIGLTGVAIHMSILQVLVGIGGLRFVSAQVVATIGAITWNFVLNNAITYKSHRLLGWQFLSGLVRFQIICSVGALSNVGVASFIYNAEPNWWLAGLLGAMMGAVWNYAVSSTLVWRSRE